MQAKWGDLLNSRGMIGPNITTYEHTTNKVQSWWIPHATKTTVRRQSDSFNKRDIVLTASEAYDASADTLRSRLDSESYDRETSKGR